MVTRDELTATDLKRLSRAEAPDLMEGSPAFLDQPGMVTHLASLVRLRAAHPGVELGGI